MANSQALDAGTKHRSLLVDDDRFIGHQKIAVGRILDMDEDIGEAAGFADGDVLVERRLSVVEVSGSLRRGEADCAQGEVPRSGSCR